MSELSRAALKRAEALVAYKPTDMSLEEFAEKLEEAARRADEMPPMTPLERASLEEEMRHTLRVIWREVDGQRRRATVFIPIDRDSLSPDFLAALDESKTTVYVRAEVNRMLADADHEACIRELEAENERLKGELSRREATLEEQVKPGGLIDQAIADRQALSTLRSKVAEEIVRMRRCCFICEWRARAFQALLDETADGEGDR